MQKYILKLFVIATAVYFVPRNRLSNENVLLTALVAILGIYLVDMLLPNLAEGMTDGTCESRKDIILSTSKVPIEFLTLLKGVNVCDQDNVKHLTSFLQGSGIPPSLDDDFKNLMKYISGNPGALGEIGYIIDSPVNLVL